MHKKSLIKAAGIFSIAALTGCSSNTVEVARNFKETPKLSTSNMSDAISCMGSALTRSASSNAYVFLIRDVIDGTVKDSIYQDGPLADAGRVQLINVLSQQLQPHVGLVTDIYPLMLKQTGKEAVGLNRFGVPSAANMQTFLASYGSIIQNSRAAKGMSPAGNIIPLVVSGTFTRFDTDNLTQYGTGQNIGSRTKRLADDERDDIWRRSSGQADIGNTSSARLLSLVLNLVDPRNNLILSSQSFDLIFYRNNKTFRLRIGAGDGYYGVSRNQVRVEGVQGAQKTLLDAAALWLMNKAYGGQASFSSCFTDEQRALTSAPAAGAKQVRRASPPTQMSRAVRPATPVRRQAAASPAKPAQKGGMTAQQFIEFAKRRQAEQLERARRRRE